MYCRWCRITTHSAHLTYVDICRHMYTSIEAIVLYQVIFAHVTVEFITTLLIYNDRSYWDLCSCWSIMYRFSHCWSNINLNLINVYINIYIYWTVICINKYKYKYKYIYILNNSIAVESWCRLHPPATYSHPSSTRGLCFPPRASSHWQSDYALVFGHRKSQVQKYFHIPSHNMGMDQYPLIPFLGGWTSIYQPFWCSPGVQGFDTLPYVSCFRPDTWCSNESE